MDMDLVYQLIVAGVILVFALLFMRIVAIVLVASIIGVSAYYGFIASEVEKEEAKVCLASIPPNLLKARFPNACNNMINTIKTKVPGELKKATTKDLNKTKDTIKNSITRL